MSHERSQEGYRSPEVGNEISSVLFGVPHEILSNTALLESALLRSLKKDNFTILDKSVVPFKPEGVTITITLGESHAAIHTYHEHNSLAFQIYSCRGEDDGSGAFEYFKKLIPHEYDETHSRRVRVGGVRK